jgi:hypothetical protein
MTGILRLGDLARSLPCPHRRSLMLMPLGVQPQAANSFGS